MRLRSLLFVPGDRPDRMDKARDAGADAVILDLEDAVAPVHKGQARSNVANFLARADKRVRLLVRINALDTAHVEADLKALEKTPPDGYVLPKADGDAVAALGERLDALRCARRPVLAIAAETAASRVQLSRSTRAWPDKLMGLTWGAEDLRAAVGAAGCQDIARRGRLHAAVRTGQRSIDPVRGACRRARPPSRRCIPRFPRTPRAWRARRPGRRGTVFSGMLAIHPLAGAGDQNQAFAPTPAALSAPRRVVAAFRDHAGEGAVRMDGSMLDAAHLRQAEQLISRAAD